MLGDFFAISRHHNAFGGSARGLRGPGSPAQTAILVLLTGAIALLDTVTPREIAAAGFYVIVVMMAIRTVSPRGVVLVALGCVVFTLASFFWNESGAQDSGVINLAICLAGIGVTTSLGLRMVSASAETQRIRAQLTHATRISALGQLTVSIAHEVNQPLTGVVTSGQAAARWLASDPPNVPRAVRAVDRLVDDANRASEIIAHVRRLAEPAPAVKTLVDMNETIRTVLTLTRRETVDNDIGIVLQLASGLPRVTADRVQMQQVLLNLVMNAVEAMRHASDQRLLSVRSALLSSGAVEVSVSDTGPGFANGQAERVFDAFYTTKPGGMGMGLVISQSIVEAHGGTIRVDQNGGSMGATFRFTVPVAGEDA